MDNKLHWDRIFYAKASGEFTWHQPHLTKSLEILQGIRLDSSARIIDVGCGDSTYVDDLLALGFSNLTLLDVSPVAIERAKRRLGDRAGQLTWLESDLREASLQPEYYDLWHDRAVFHFLVDPLDRHHYVSKAEQALKPGGHLVIATFSVTGPESCSGLKTMRYSPESLSAAFGERFRLYDSQAEVHHTPKGGEQNFLYCHLVKWQ
jgi:SAM-dependent methyltransferase